MQVATAHPSKLGQFALTPLQSMSLKHCGVGEGVGGAVQMYPRVTPMHEHCGTGNGQLHALPNVAPVLLHLDVHESRPPLTLAKTQANAPTGPEQVEVTVSAHAHAVGTLGAGQTVPHVVQTGGAGVGGGVGATHAPSMQVPPSP